VVQVFREPTRDPRRYKATQLKLQHAQRRLWQREKERERGS